jgi:hypothetical protein
VKDVHARYIAYLADIADLYQKSFLVMSSESYAGFECDVLSRLPL